MSLSVYQLYDMLQAASTPTGACLGYAAAFVLVPLRPIIQHMKRILVTNDDGVHSEGIKALADALKPLGEVTVVAPLPKPAPSDTR